MPEYAFGWRPQLPDHRDHLFLAPYEAAAIPAKTDLRPCMPPVGNQLTIGSCTAWASTAAWRAELMRQGKPDLDVSELAQYFWTRALEGTTRSDAGGTLRDAVKVLARTGVAPEALWPYDVTKFAKTPPATVRRAARAHLALEYQAVSQTALGIKGALAGGHPVVFGCSVYASFESAEVARTGVVPMPSRQEALLGGHALCIVGHDDERGMYIVRNSWGPGFGDAGYIYMPYAYIESPKLSSDFWIVKAVSG